MATFSWEADVLVELLGPQVTAFLAAADDLLTEVRADEHATVIAQGKESSGRLTGLLRTTPPPPMPLPDLYAADVSAGLLLLPRLGSGPELRAVAVAHGLDVLSLDRRRASLRSSDAAPRPVSVRFDHWDAREAALALAVRLLAWDDLLAGRRDPADDPFGESGLAAVPQPDGVEVAPGKELVSLLNQHRVDAGAVLHTSLKALARQALAALEDGPFGEPYRTDDPAAQTLATLICDEFALPNAWLWDTSGVDVKKMVALVAAHPDWVAVARGLTSQPRAIAASPPAPRMAVGDLGR
jgi:hypothetical protein